MTSDEIIKKAEEYALKSGWSCIDEQLAGAEAFAIKQAYIDAYTQGRADALKELEQRLEAMEFSAKQSVAFGALLLLIKQLLPGGESD